MIQNAVITKSSLTAFKKKKCSLRLLIFCY